MKDNLDKVQKSCHSLKDKITVLKEASKKNQKWYHKACITTSVLGVLSLVAIVACVSVHIAAFPIVTGLAITAYCVVGGAVAAGFFGGSIVMGD